MEENWRIVLNGRCQSDSPAQINFINSNGKSVIDLVWRSESALDIIDDLVIQDYNNRSDNFSCQVMNNNKCNQTTLEKKKTAWI